MPRLVTLRTISSPAVASSAFSTTTTYSRHMNSNTSNSYGQSSAPAATPSSRFLAFLQSLPFFTLCLLFLNVFIHLMVFLFTWPIYEYTFNPFDITYHYEVYRIITSAFLHGGLFHIAMNMMSLVALGSLLEKAYGSLRFFWLTFLCLWLAGAYALVISYVLAIFDSQYWYINSIGYSGVLFAYAAIDSFHTTETSRSVFGLVNVPTKAYPFAMLIVMQLILPNISFTGHLGGLLAGLTIISPISSMCCMLSQERLQGLESLLIPAFVRRQSSYIAAINRELLHPMFGAGGNGCGQALCSAIAWAFGYLGSAMFALGVIIGLPMETLTSNLTTAWQDCCRALGNLGSGWSTSAPAHGVSPAAGYALVANQDVENNSSVHSESRSSHPLLSTTVAPFQVTTTTGRGSHSPLAKISSPTTVSV